MIKLSTILKLVFNASIIAGVVACAKTQHQTANGGQDSGGGNTTASTMEDVQEAYSYAKENIGNIFYSLMYARYKNKIRENYVDRLRKRLEKLTPEADEYKGIDLLVESTSFKMKYDGPCSSKDNLHADASIKEFKVTSEVCVSFSQLTKLPKDSLDKQISGLLVHEYTHALGFNEKDAVEIQSIVVDNFDLIQPNLYHDPSDQQLFDNDYFMFEGLTELSKGKLIAQNWMETCALIAQIEPFSIDLRHQDAALYDRFGRALIKRKLLTLDQIKNRADEVENARSEAIKALFEALSQCKSLGKPTKKTKDLAKIALQELDAYKQLISQSSELLKFQ